MQKLKKKQKGITLIALIITIIVMLILVGVTINVALNGGLFDTAREASRGTKKAAEKEELISISIGSFDSTGNFNKEKFKTAIASKIGYGFEETTNKITTPEGNVFYIDGIGNIVEDEIAKKETQGTYIVANDVDSVQHDLKITLTSDTITDFSSVSVSRYGSNLLDMSKMLNSNLIDNNDGTYNFNFTGSQKSEFYDIFIPAGVPIMATINNIEDTLSKQFKLQLIFEDGTKEYITLRGATTWDGYEQCLTFEKNITKVAFLLVAGAQSGEYIKFSEPKLNVGYIQPYEEFKGVENLTANSNGLVEGLKSISPNMTIITNNNEVEINCKYNLQNVQYNLFGKTIVNFGDSIFGNYRKPTDISTYIESSTNATVYNVGFGGCRIAEHPSADYNAFCMYRLAESIVSNNWELQNVAASNLSSDKFNEKLETLKLIDFSKVDIITIAYGTNDFMGSINETEFKNALKNSIQKITNAYPNIEIVLCTPIYRFWMDENNEFLYDSDTYEKLSGQKLTDFVQWIKDVASEYDLFVIDNYNNCGINSQNRTEYFPANDGTHPNAAGRKMIAEYMAKKLYEEFKQY